ncbi:hypothetical protein [Bilophila wadsworthia]|uniref:hypothetical protein n=1 Tax=Bilophila wadsworthia TaxID=35833 RepID=UPI0035206610
MSSTIFSATSGTSISVDPHADVEGAGQQNPAVPHDAQNGAPAPGNPPNEDLVQAEARLRQMLDTALDRSGGLRGIGGDLYDAIKTEIPRPKVFHGGFRIHSAMLKAANACDVAAANLRRIPIADFHANPLPDAAFAALEAFVGAQNELYTQIGAFQKASGVSAALLDSLAQATQFRASEALNFAATMQLAAMPAERRQQIAPGVADPQAPTAGKAMQDMAHFMHGSGDVAGAFRADAARLFGSIDALEGRKGQMPLAEFRDTATRLRGDLEALRGRIDGAIHPNADPGGGPVLIPDRTLFAPAEAMLARSAERLDALASADSQSGRQIRPCARSCRPWTSPCFPRPRPCPAGLGTPLATGLARYNAKVSEIMTRLDAGALSPERLAHEMEDAVHILPDPGDSPGLRHAPDHDGNRGAPYHRPQRKSAATISISAANASRAAWRTCCAGAWGKNGFVLVPSEMKRLAAQIENTPLLTRDGILVSEFQEGRRDACARPGPTRRRGANTSRPRWITMWT